MHGIEDTTRLDAYMFDAALGDITFDQVIKKITTHFDGSGGVIFELNRKTGAISNWVGPGLEDGEQDYIDHLNSINPRMRYSLRHTPGHVTYDALCISETAMDRHEFYDAILRASGTRYFLGSRLYDDGDLSVFHSVEFDPAHGHPQKDKIDVFTRTARNMGKAWKLAKTQAHISSSHNENYIFEHLPWAVFSADHKGRIVPQNENAKNLVFSGSPLALIEGRLLTASNGVNNTIVNFAKRAIAGHAGSMALRMENSHTPFIMQSMPVPGKQEAFLFIRDPRQSSALFEHVLPNLFGLSAAEIRVINVLAMGKNLQSVAEDLQISRNTVRNHLQNIFHKTNTQSRTELLVQILGLIDH